MDVWHLILYGVAIFFAIRSLVMLMMHHRSKCRQQLYYEFEFERRLAKAKAKKAAREQQAESEHATSKTATTPAAK